ncbi:MAG: hypothetical protein ACRER3_05980, partial [Pseudomonas fluorescens]
ALQQHHAIELLNLAEDALSHASLDSLGDVIEHTQDRRDHMRVQIIAFLKSLGGRQLSAPVELDGESSTCAKSQVEQRGGPVVDAGAINTSWMTDEELDAICSTGSGNKAKRRIEAINKARGDA